MGLKSMYIKYENENFFRLVYRNNWLTSENVNLSKNMYLITELNWKMRILICTAKPALFHLEPSTFVG